MSVKIKVKETLDLIVSASTADQNQGEQYVKTASTSKNWASRFCGKVEKALASDLPQEAKTKLIKALPLVQEKQYKAMAILGCYLEKVSGKTLNAVIEALGSMQGESAQTFKKMIIEGSCYQRNAIVEAFDFLKLSNADMKVFVDEAMKLNPRLYARRRSLLQVIAAQSNTSVIKTRLDELIHHYRPEVRLLALEIFLSVEPQHATRNRVNGIALCIGKHNTWQQNALGCLALAHMCSEDHDLIELSGKWIDEIYHSNVVEVCRTAVVCALKTMGIGLNAKMQQHYKKTKVFEPHILAYVKAGLKSWPKN